MADPIDAFLENKLKELVLPAKDPISTEDSERHRIYRGALAAITRYYWNGNKRGRKGTYPRNPKNEDWEAHCPNLQCDYFGHNIAALAVDSDGLVIDFEFNHNELFDSSAEHAEARLVRRLFMLTQIQDSWNVASETNPADKYSNALSKVSLYTTLESCTQCTGVMMLGRVRDVIYLQRDPGMYQIGDLLHTLTARKAKPDTLAAPRPIPASFLGDPVQSSLESAYAEYCKDIVCGDAFFEDGPDNKDRSSSITSFLCTASALDVFSNSAETFASLVLDHPSHKPVWSTDAQGDFAKRLTNEQVLREARSFVAYATSKGQRGTPHH